MGHTTLEYYVVLNSNLHYNTRIRLLNNNIQQWTLNSKYTFTTSEDLALQGSGNMTPATTIGWKQGRYLHEAERSLVEYRVLMRDWNENIYRPTNELWTGQTAMACIAAKREWIWLFNKHIKLDCLPIPMTILCCKERRQHEWICIPHQQVIS